MEEIAQLRTKYLKTDTSVLKRLLLARLEKIDEIKKHQDQQFNEHDAKIKGLTSKLELAKGTLDTETQTLKEKTDELSKLDHQLKELETEKQKCSQEIKQLEGKRNTLKCAKQNQRDQQVLQQGKRKLKLYKDLTRIHWDYEASHHSVKGYISNGRNYIHHFCYADQQINHKLTDSLWHEIYLSTGEAAAKDENLQPNVSNTE